jgi:hypothetical protein
MHTNDFENVTLSKAKGLATVCNTILLAEINLS